MGLPQIKIKPRHKPKRALEFYQNSTDPVERKRAHFIWLLLEGNNLQEVEEVVDYSHVQAIEIIKNYNQFGFNGLIDKRKSNRGRPPLLSDPQILLLAQIIRYDYDNGILWNAQKVRDWMEV